MGSALENSQALDDANDPDDLDEEYWQQWMEDEQNADEVTTPPAANDDDNDDDDAPPEPDIDDRVDDASESASEPDSDAASEAPLPIADAQPAQPATTAPCSVVVAQGECLLSIARRFRTTVPAIWDAPQNAALKKLRKSNQLLPGDSLFIPASDVPDFRAPTQQRHRFRLMARKECTISLRFLRGGKPRAQLRFTLVVDGTAYEGETDAEGRLQVRVPADAREGTLTLHSQPREERYPVRLGHLNPIDDITGVQTRLTHLGFVCGPIDGILGPRTRRALRLFQRSRKLTASGEPDNATKSELEKAHGS